MKPSELRIGNLLFHNNEIITVKGISPHCGDYAINTDSSWVYLKNCEPIQLTEEWLLKFGYLPCSFAENHFYIKGHVIWKCNDMFLCDKNGVVLQYVHHLQNLYFAVSNKELEIIK